MTQTQQQLERQVAPEGQSMISQPRCEEQTRPIPNRPIQWAVANDLDGELEILQNRNWINEELITVSRKHWNCSRAEAVQRLVASLDECSE